MNNYVKIVLLKVMKLEGIETEVVVLKSNGKKAARKIKQLTESVAKNKKEINILKTAVCENMGKIDEIGQFLYNETCLEKYFVQNGHDPQGERCDICKGREMGILDYRRDVLAVFTN